MVTKRYRPGTVCSLVTSLGAMLGLTACLLAVGCQTAPAAPPDPVLFRWGETFSLPAGQSAVSDGDELRVNFDRVLTDSRCPAQVSCFWTGEAHHNHFRRAEFTSAAHPPPRV